MDVNKNRKANRWDCIQIKKRISITREPSAKYSSKTFTSFRIDALVSNWEKRENLICIDNLETFINANSARINIIRDFNRFYALHWRIIVHKSVLLEFGKQLVPIEPLVGKRHAINLCRN